MHATIHKKIDDIVGHTVIVLDILKIAGISQKTVVV